MAYHPLKAEIKTNRLVLRQLRLSDALAMFEYTSNPKVTTFLNWEPNTNIEQAKAFIEDKINKIDKLTNEFTYGIELIEEKKLIGAIRLSNVCFNNKHGEFTSILNPAYQGKGYMAEAWQGLLNFCFNKLGLQRIQSYVSEDNIASIKKNDRAGLTYEGRLKKYWIIKGVTKDALVYGITDEMFNKK